ncbi:MAG TPA: Zn-ribbon domain-containing OB-fold protein, partial [Planctomycetota bacterium]|nr:Zn-ribbon domain-containing OB-fold protein [Planctomycetota bacterium]
SPELSRVHGEIPLRSLYTAGIAGEAFFRAIKDRGELIGSRCKPCNQVYVPSRIFCERCFAELSDTVRVGLAGRVVALTQVHLGMDNERLAEPVTVVAVQLDGASTALVHRLRSGITGAKVGMRVRAVLRPPGERVGGILDLLHFDVP